MSIDLPRARPRISAHAASTLALLSPLLVGMVWGPVAFISWRIAMNSPDANLGTLFAFWGVLFYGAIGLGLLLVPVTVGLVARDPETRLAAAWVEAAMCALAALFGLLSVIPNEYRKAPDAFTCFSLGALVVPLLITIVATRFVLGRGRR